MLVPRSTAGPSGYELRHAHVRTPLRADVSFALGFGAGILVTLLAWLVGAGHAPLIGLVLLALTAAAVGSVSTSLGAFAAAIPVWALDTGFIVNRFGELSLDHRSIATFAAIALAAITASLITNRTRQP